MRWAVALAAVVTLTVGSGCALIPSENSGESRPSSASTSSAPSPTPSRSTDPTGDADAAQCRPDDCPKLPTPTAELMTSGVTPANVDTAVPDYLTTLLDDLDQTFVNGVLVGATGDVDAGVVDGHEWQVERVYRVPASVLREGDNVVAVRVFDGPLDGGIHEGPVALMLPAAAAARGLSVPDDDR